MKPEEFCSYELSMRLKERGFNEECDYYYTDTKLLNRVTNRNDILSGKLCSAPIRQKARRWIRSEFGININVVMRILDFNESLDKIPVYRVYYILPTVDWKNCEMYDGRDFETYEVAEYKAMMFCLDKLI